MCLLLDFQNWLWYVDSPTGRQTKVCDIVRNCSPLNTGHGWQQHARGIASRYWVLSTAGIGGSVSIIVSDPVAASSDPQQGQLQQARSKRQARNQSPSSLSHGPRDNFEMPSTAKSMLLLGVICDGRPEPTRLLVTVSGKLTG